MKWSLDNYFELKTLHGNFSERNLAYLACMQPDAPQKICTNRYAPCPHKLSCPVAEPSADRHRHAYLKIFLIIYGRNKHAASKSVHHSIHQIFAKDHRDCFYSVIEHAERGLYRRGRWPSRLRLSLKQPGICRFVCRFFPKPTRQQQYLYKNKYPA